MGTKQSLILQRLFSSIFQVSLERCVTICRNTPARHAANPYQRERHPDAQEKLKQYILSTRL